MAQVEDDDQLTRASAYGDILLPGDAPEPILAAPVRAALLQWITEVQAADKLAAVGVEPRRKAMFSGPPGVGKTTLAHHLCGRLGLPMLAVKSELLKSKYVGESARLVGGLFALAGKPFRHKAIPGGSAPLLVFLDEFEAIGHKRSANNDGGAVEDTAAVATLLRGLDGSKGFVIAATNHADRVDPALWRRFDIQIALELPGPGERRRILKRYLDPFGLPEAELAAFADSFETASPALMRNFCEALKRQIVLSPLLDLDRGLAATVERVLAALQPHPDCGRPRLWTLGRRDQGLQGVTWPLALAADLVVDPPAEPASPGSAVGGVIEFSGRRRK